MDRAERLVPIEGVAFAIVSTSPRLPATEPSRSAPPRRVRTVDHDVAPSRHGPNAGDRPRSTERDHGHVSSVCSVVRAPTSAREHTEPQGGEDRRRLCVTDVLGICFETHLMSSLRGISRWAESALPGLEIPHDPRDYQPEQRQRSKPSEYTPGEHHQ
jgi:hypothetical protein